MGGGKESTEQVTRRLDVAAPGPVEAELCLRCGKAEEPTKAEAEMHGGRRWRCQAAELVRQEATTACDGIEEIADACNLILPNVIVLL